MTQVHGVRHVDFDGAQLSFFLDLSRHTLMQCRALKPLLVALQDAHLTDGAFCLAYLLLRVVSSLPCGARLICPIFSNLLDCLRWTFWIGGLHQRYLSQLALNHGRQAIADADVDLGEAHLTKHRALAPHRRKIERGLYLKLAPEKFLDIT